MKPSSHNAADFSGAAAVPTDPRWQINVADLLDAVGSSVTLAEDRPAPEGLATPVAEISENEPIHLQLRIDAVHEGLVVSGRAEAQMHAECSRCLNPIEEELSVDISELYDHEPQPDLDPEEQRLIVHGVIDLELPVRNALLEGFPFQPVCRPDCPGLCDQCGIRLEDAEPGHHHEQRDPRWAALAALASPQDEADGATLDTQTSNPETKER